MVALTVLFLQFSEFQWSDRPGFRTASSKTDVLFGCILPDELCYAGESDCIPPVLSKEQFGVLSI